MVVHYLWAGDSDIRYFAQVGTSEYYHLFMVAQGHSKMSSGNDFIKWRVVLSSEGHRNLRTDEYTVHPDKIHRVAIHPKGTKLLGFKGTGREYETLYEFGYDGVRECLVSLYHCQVNGGFVGRKKASAADGVDAVVSFPADIYRPYWIGAYFTTYDLAAVQEIFKREELDEILLTSGEHGNVVTLVKHLVPEWEMLKVEPEDKSYGWVHPSFSLRGRYHVVVLKP